MPGAFHKEISIIHAFANKKILKKIIGEEEKPMKTLTTTYKI